MAGDISRSTFDPVKHYTGVRQQQGRVSMDADWNEQVDIGAYHVQTEAADVLGRASAPRDNAGFRISPLPRQGPSTDLAISPGRIYVDGILCELESTSAPILKFASDTQVQLANLIVDGREFEADQWIEVFDRDNPALEPLQIKIKTVTVAVDTKTATLTLAESTADFPQLTTQPRLRRITTYKTQFDSPSATTLPTVGSALAYLDVWERTVTELEDPGIREPALGITSGTDTATRTKTVCQVKLMPIPLNTTCAGASGFEVVSNAQMAARAEPTAPATAACILPPKARFRRLENQLYRVEIHTGGTIASGAPTFKWSRDNASVVAAITSVPVLNDKTITALKVRSLGRDATLGFGNGQFVELTDDVRELKGEPGILVQLTGAATGSQGPVLTADASVADPADLGRFVASFADRSVRNPKVRRWDQPVSVVSKIAPGGDIKVQEGTWINLESGVQVFFQPGGTYQSGDYWLIPARTVAGDVVWPRDSFGNPQVLLPPGTRHHYARLATISFNTPSWAVLGDCRQIFPPMAERGIRINTVFLSNFSPVSPNGGLLLNDASVALQDLAAGIGIVFDTPIDPVVLRTNTSLSKPVCFVTIDVPNIAPDGKLPFAAQRLIVSADLSLDPTDSGGRTILWRPTLDAANWIQTQLKEIVAQLPGALLAHLTLRGNFIWSREDPSLYLDGEGFGVAVLPDAAGNRRTDLVLPGGDGRRGGDFQMWFRLIALPAALIVSPPSVSFDSQPVNTPSKPAKVDVTNNSSGPLKITSISASGDFTPIPASPIVLDAGKTLSVSITFNPVQAGPRQGNVTVNSDIGGSRVISLDGIGTDANLDAPTPISFRALQFAQDTNKVTLTNKGSLPTMISAVTISGPAAPEYFIRGGCIPSPDPKMVPAGESCDLVVTFQPVGIGERNCSIKVTHSSGTLVIELEGTSVQRFP